MKTHIFYTRLPDENDVALHFHTIEVSGRYLLADGESLHELDGYTRPSIEDGGTYDAALV